MNNTSTQPPHDLLLDFPDRAEVELLLNISLFSQDDEVALRKTWRILKEQTDDYLDMIFGMAAAHPVLATTLSALHGNTWKDTVTVVALDNVTIARSRFRRWLFETCFFPYEPPWLKQIYSDQSPKDSMARFAEIALPNFRYAIALAYPLVATARSLLVVNEQNNQEIERMQHALLKAILLQITLLSKLYIKEELW